MNRPRVWGTVVLALLVALTSYAAAAPVRLGPVTDPIGVVRVARGQPIIIAYWLVIAGPNASLGVDSRRGIELAIADKRTVAGHPIRLIGEDSGCNAEGGVTAATKIAANRQVVAAVGSSCSSEAVPGAPILWRAGIVTVSPSNTAPRLTAPDRGPTYDGYLRTAHNDQVQGRVAAHFAYHALSSRRAATIHDGSPYAEGLANVFADVYRRLGGTITAQEAISPGDTDMRPVLTRIATGRPDVIYYPIFVAEGGHITRQAKEVSGLERTRLMAADGTFSPDFLRAAGPAARGMFLSSPDLSEEALGPRYTEFLRKHQQRYGERPLSAFHAHAYDAAMMIFAAIERVARKDAAGNTYIGRRALRDALFATRNFRGITGNLTCNQFGDCADPKIAVYEVVSADPAQWSPGTDPRKVWPRR
ncbi:MAG: branched-chain amino acid ABC transporter substrate-binding protein [Armatimonadota bacterium]|nr:branched-chain amino acid ABC transporter substrate-binding protein [Armatimonadota bacterium]MDR5696824.1 branched-chain amino acid ABC transporter substrate-binding protein [Armatimonadota bacterium]